MTTGFETETQFFNEILSNEKGNEFAQECASS